MKEMVCDVCGVKKREKTEGHSAEGPCGAWADGPSRACPQPEGAGPGKWRGGVQGEEGDRPLEAARHPTTTEVVSECLSGHEWRQGGD